MQILELALQGTQEFLGRQGQLPRRMRHRVDGRGVRQAVADRNGDQFARSQLVPGREAGMNVMPWFMCTNSTRSWIELVSSVGVIWMPAALQATSIRMRLPVFFIGEAIG